MGRYNEVFQIGAKSPSWDIESMGKSLQLLRKIDTKGIGATSKEESTNRYVRMPDGDIANLGKNRGCGIVWECGDWYEAYVWHGERVNGVSNSTHEALENKPRMEIEGIISPQERAAMRARRNIRRICNAEKVKFLWTLTMAPQSGENSKKYKCVSHEKQTNYDYVRKLWKAFIKRFHRSSIRFPWIMILELHDGEDTSLEKRGTWHLHFASSWYINTKWVWRNWPHGIVDVKEFHTKKKYKESKTSVATDDIGSYIAKYVGKNFSVENFNRKRYSCSRDIKRPRKWDIENGMQIVKGREAKLMYSKVIMNDVGMKIATISRYRA